jgi:divalent metal cation (Fe/Co/Zn/Cd) transporter
MNPGTRKKAVAWLSVFSNTALVALKLIVGLLIGSVSVTSEGAARA